MGKRIAITYKSEDRDGHLNCKNPNQPLLPLQKRGVGNP